MSAVTRGGQAVRLLGLMALGACVDAGGSASITLELPGREELALRATGGSGMSQNANAVSDANTTVGNANSPATNPNLASNGNSAANPNAVATPSAPNIQPSNRVDAYQVKAHATGMTTVTGSATPDASTLTLNVPAGPKRVIEVLALRTDIQPPLPTYFASDTLDLTAGTEVPLSVVIVPAGLIQGSIAVTSSEQQLLAASLQAIPASGGGPIELGLDGNAVFSQPLPVGAYTVRGSVSLDGLAGTLQGNPNFVVRQGVATTLSVYVQLPGKCDASHPIDHDGDGVACDTDCDDTDVNNWNSCKTCVDEDSDHARVGCDAYRTLTGPDCDDHNANSWDTCNTCKDLDGDGHYGACNAYVTVPGPDCDDADRSNWVSCAACVDQDKDGSYTHCDAYLNRHGPDCDDNDINNWVSCDYCQDHDGDKYYVSCDQYASIGADCDDFDKYNWTSCASCVDNDYDGSFVGCDSYAPATDQNALIHGPDCNDRFDACNISCANDCVAKAIGFAALPGDDSITVKWQAIPNARSYNVYVSTDPSVAPGHLAGGFVLQHAQSPFVVRGVHNGTTYYVALSDFDLNGTETLDAGPVMVTPANTFESIMQVAAGNVHSVALKADGTVWTWGSNPYGQLGLPNAVSQPIPALVQTPAHFVQVAAGLNHTLALDDQGSVWSWGDNTRFQLGLAGSAALPTQVPGLAAIIAIVAGDNHSLALDKSGVVWAWGDNSTGQLGLNSNNVSFPTPTALSGKFAAAPIVSLSAAGNHSFAVDSNQVAWSWGDNSNNQVGVAVGAGPVKLPNVMTYLPTARSVFATRLGGFALAGNANTYQWGNNTYGQLGTGNGYTIPLNFQYAPGAWTFSGALHTLALDPQGRVYTFGNNASNQLGRPTGSTQDSNVLALANLPSVRAVAVGANHSLAITQDGSVLAWGDNSAGQVGIGPSQTQVAVPTKVGSMIKVATGSSHSVALGSDGSVWVWGDNSSGQLASDTYGASSTPSRVNLPLAAVDIASGSSHVLALTADGNVWAWGDNWYYELGDPNNTNNSSGTPAVVQGLPPVRAVAAGADFCLAVDNSNNVWGWGDNNNHELGTMDDTALARPIKIAGISGVRKVAAGSYHVLALKTDGSVWAWGDNSSSQLGGTPTTDGTPISVISSYAADIAAGYSQSLAMDTSGYVSLWGGDYYGQAADGNVYGDEIPTPRHGAALTGTFKRIAAGNDMSIVVNANFAQVYGQNYYGQSGNGNTTQAGTSGPVSLPSAPVAVGTGPDSDHILAVTNDGTVWAWGSSTYGKLGRPDDGSGQSGLPGPVNFTRRATQVAAGNGFSVALLNDATVASWGDNSAGELGVGLVAAQALAPVHTSLNNLTSIKQLAVGNQHVLALDGNGALWVWGNNTRGQLGDGSLGVRALPHLQSTYTPPYRFIAAGGDHSIAVDNANFVYTWGANDQGQLGTNNTTDLSAPSNPIAYPTDLRGVAAADCTSYYWTGTGFYSWGCNTYGQLGSGSAAAYSQAPNTLIPLSGIQTLCAGLHHALALLSDGSVWAWGDDAAGQLGDGASTPRGTPQRVPNLPPMASIACGGNGSLAVGRNGGVFVWGTHPGWGNQTARTPSAANFLTLSAPTVLSARQGVASASLSSTHLLLQNANGALVSSGANDSGQLGIGSTASASGVVFVQGL